MKRFTRFGLCSLVGVFALSACGDDSIKLDTSPAVSVSADKSSGTGPLDVQFFSSVVNGNGEVSYNWNFGDGESSTLANPGHTFEANEEAYTVLLTVTDEDGDDGVAVLQVAVGTDAQPTVMVSAAPQSGTVPLTVAFDCTAGGGDGELDLEWSFGEGSRDSFATTSFTYTQNGVYIASCTVTDDDGDVARDTLTIAVGSDIIPGIPQAIANATPITGTAPLEVDFFGSSLGGDGTITLDWDFGDGESDTVGNVSHTYADPGIYNALLTATDEDGDADTALITITVVDPQVGVNVAPNAVASIVSGACAMTGRTTVQLDGSTSSDPNGDAVFLSWQFVSVPSGSNAFFNNSTVTNPVFTPDRDGDYVLRLVANDGLLFDASDELTVTADGPTVIVSTAGDAQDGEVNTTLTDLLAVNVSNSCGATASNIDVRWSGFNMNPGFSETDTTADGDTGTAARFGTNAGSGTITATVESTNAEVTFNYTMFAGDAVALVMDDASTVVVSDTASTLTYRVTDNFGNPVTAPDVTFDLELDPATASDALFTDCTTGTKTLTGVTTTQGVATVQVCNTNAEDVFIATTQILTAGIVPAGRVTLFQDDMERDDNSWRNNASDGNDWERGAPTFPGALTVPSPSNVRGTVLDGELFDIGVSNSTSMSRSFDLSYPVGFIFGVELSFDHYVDIVSSCGQATLMRGCENCTTIRPVGGYPAGCSREGFEGPFDDFQPVEYDLSPFAGDDDLELFWTVRYSDSFNPVSGAGWYIDDVAVNALVQVPRVRFIAGPAAEVTLSLEQAGKVDSCASSVVSGFTTDVFGNVVTASGDELTLTSSNVDVTFTAATIGGDFTGAGTATSTVTTVDGVVEVLLDTSLTAGTINSTVTAVVTGIAAGPNATAVSAHEQPSTEICGDGFDNDCDGLLDCADLDQCSDSPACHGESCFDPFDLGSGDLVATFNTCFHANTFNNACRNGSGEDMLSSFEAIADDETYDVCIDASDIPGVSDILVTSDCGTGGPSEFGQCYFNADDGQQCQSFFGLPAGFYFLLWQGEEPGQCGDLSVDINVRENCFDNVDNDLDGDTDCEDQECIDDGNCDRFGSDDTCDFTDDGSNREVSNGGFAPDGTIDEFACRCAGDEGCDGMTNWAGITGSLLCNVNFAVCIPDCAQVPNMCENFFGQTCNATTGQCE